jgi:hypothetical protein
MLAVLIAMQRTAAFLSSDNQRQSADVQNLLIDPWRRGATDERTEALRTGSAGDVSLRCCGKRRVFRPVIRPDRASQARAADGARTFRTESGLIRQQ